MRTVTAFIKAGLVILFLAAASTMSFGQEMGPLPPEWIGDDPKFEVEVTIHETIDGKYLLMAINPNTDDMGYFNKKYYRVEWLNLKGRTIGNGIWMLTTCSKEGWAVVTSLRSNAKVEARFKTPICVLIFEEAEHIELLNSKNLKN